jgi:pimeloyl-ACP methyl ester carboxylesterase
MKIVPMTPALEARRLRTNGRSGPLSYYVGGDGPPLLLLHSINAAASAHEVAPLFLHAAKTRRVYAPDLPGFGYSDRSDRRYGIGLYCDAVRDMLAVIATDSGSTPLDALALSLSAEFLARVATEAPTAFRTLTLVTPTGFSRGANMYRAAPGSNRELPGIYMATTIPLWRESLYAGLVSRRSIRYFLERTFGSKNVPDALVEYSWITSHQPGASNAPFAFLSGRLFSRDIRNVYERLALPIWLPHGTRGDFKDFSEASWTRTRRNWTVQAYATGAMIHFEQPEAFCADWDSFLARPGG